jgi:hypothetical protein
MSTIRALFASLLIVSPAVAQAPNDPFPDRIATEEGVIRVNFREFAVLPDADGVPARAMHAVSPDAVGRIFVLDMGGRIYSVSRDGTNVELYLDLLDPRWGVSVEAGGRERGIQSFAIHPQFGFPGAPGFGKFYTWGDSNNVSPVADFPSGGEAITHHTVLLEWTARSPASLTYDGAAPREVARFAQPFGNHNGGQLAFNPLVVGGDPDYGMLYVGIADGGSGGDPMNLSQNLTIGFGKIFRIDPLGTNGPTGKYGIPADNPFVGDSDALPEIWAVGVRNPQRFAWDPETGAMYVTDIGQNIVEEISIAWNGANLGWNTWEGSFRFISREAVDLANPRSDPSMSYPVSEYAQLDPLFEGQSCCAASGAVVYRGTLIPQLTDKVLWGDNPSGEIFWFDADNVPEGGPASVHRVLLNHEGEARTLLQVIQDKNQEQGREPATRVDMRMGVGPAGEILLLNKQDGVIRMLVP